jgi:hypothetical protein
MGKKKGKKTKKKKDDGGGSAPKGLQSAEETRRQALIKRAKAVQRSIDAETSDFDQFQQQRDQLNYFWIVEKKNLEDKKSERRHKDREMQDMEEKHQVDIKLYKQSVKHLLFEHQNEVTSAKTENESELKRLEDANRNNEFHLKEDRRGLKARLKEMDLSHEATLRSLKQSHDQSIYRLRHEFERRAREMQLKHEKRTKATRRRLETSRRLETQRIEDRKNAHIGRLMKEHERAFADIKDYYHDITHNNLDLIKALKEEVAEAKKKERQDTIKMTKITQENKRMYEPLKVALADVERLRGELEEYEKDKEELAKTKATLLEREQTLKTLRWEQEVTAQRFEGVKKERDELYEEFQRAVYAVKQKSGFKNLLIEKKLGAMSEELEKREAQLSELLSHANVDAAAVPQLNKRWDDVIELKNQSVRDLQQSLGGLITQHNEMVQHYEQKMLAYGIPVEELGFMPQLLTMPQTLK